uniref:protein-serine/threonine phosphatase n=1 Tax=Acrobeloides nanus TaxID=290746 RepID=A0A914D7H4_9BILA
MGQTLGEPITTKETASCANSYYKVGSSAMQGWRVNMEDAHTHLLALPDDAKAAFFAVYDGHGGSRVSQYAGLHLHKRIVNNSFYAEGKIREALEKGFLDLDEQMLADGDTKEDMSGTTAIVVLIKDDIVYCSNVGDSRAIASIVGKEHPLSYDHKPGNDDEAKRIVEAGGWVEFNRVNGNLALSRALGDFAFKRNENKSAKEQIVTAFPDVTTCDVNKDLEFIVLACDGIWDVMSNQEVIDFCRTRLVNGMEPEKVCEELLDRCLAPDCELSGLGCDNMTVILVCMLQNDSPDEYLQRLARPAPVEVQENNSEQVELKTDTATATPETPELFSTPSQSPTIAHEISDDEKPPSEFKVLVDDSKSKKEESKDE